MGCWDIQALLCARICHDLSGVVGAAAAGVELLEETCPPVQSDDADVLRFVLSATGGAVARVRFLRLALGPEAPTHPISLIKQTIADYISTLGDGGIQLDWSFDADLLQGEQAKILANMLMVVGDTLTTEGIVNVHGTAASQCVNVHTPCVSLSPTITAILTAEDVAFLPPPQTPKEAQALLLRHLLSESGGILTLIHAPNDAGFSLKATWGEKEN